MRNITIVYKDVTANKITVAQDEIRIKVRPCDEYNVNLAKFINYCIGYFENKVYPVTVRYRIEQTVNTCSLQILDSQKERLGYSTCRILHIKFEEQS